MINIIYEDNHIIVVIKPVGIPVQQDKTGDIDMLTIIKDYLNLLSRDMKKSTEELSACSVNNQKLLFYTDNETVEVSYTYDKTKLIGQYEVGGDYEESAHGTLKFNVDWEYEGNGTDTENLAKYMLPKKFIVIKEFPKTMIGKIDYKELEKMYKGEN